MAAPPIPLEMPAPSVARSAEPVIVFEEVSIGFEDKPVLDAISGPWVYTGAFGTGVSMKYVANMLLASHTAAAAEAIQLARGLGLDLDLVQQTLDNSIGSSAICP